MLDFAKLIWKLMIRAKRATIKIVVNIIGKLNPLYLRKGPYNNILTD